MCGRYKQTTKAAELGRVFGAVVDAAFVDGTIDDRPRFNAAPTNMLPLVRVLDGHRALRPARWGLVPPWAKDPGATSPLLNARSETLAEKPAFRDALRLRRCVVPVDGFYEWKSEGKSKSPYLFSFEDERPFALAGLWSSWSGPLGVVDTYAIVTTEANPLLRTLHDRMPILLDPSSYDEWLDPARATVDLEALRAPRDWPGLSMRPVSRRLGSVKHDDASLLVADSDDEALPAATTTQKKTQTKARPTQGSLF